MLHFHGPLPLSTALSIEGLVHRMSSFSESLNNIEGSQPRLELVTLSRTHPSPLQRKFIGEERLREESKDCLHKRLVNNWT